MNTLHYRINSTNWAVASISLPIWKWNCFHWFAWRYACWKLTAPAIFDPEVKNFSPIILSTMIWNNHISHSGSKIFPEWTNVHQGLKKGKLKLKYSEFQFKYRTWYKGMVLSFERKWIVILNIYFITDEQSIVVQSNCRIFCNLTPSIIIHKHRIPKIPHRVDNCPVLGETSRILG